MGCPQSVTGDGTGRLFFVFLKSDGTINGYTEIPADTDLVLHDVGLQLKRLDLLGRSLAAYRDVVR